MGNVLRRYEAEAETEREAPVITVKRPKETRVTQTERAGIIFPVGRMTRRLRQGGYAKRIGKRSSVYLAAVCEYLVAEINDLAGEQAFGNKRKRIIPRHIVLAVRNDAELNVLMKDVIFPQGGVNPLIHKELTRPIRKSLRKPSKV